MARKSKRMALYEAIRQGQVNIAKGLENGKLRSNGVPQESAKPQIQDNIAPLIAKERSLAVKVPFKIRAIAIGVVGFVVLFLVIGLILRSGDNGAVVPTETSIGVSPISPKTELEKTERSQKTEEESSGFLGFGKNKTPQSQPETKVSTPVTPPSSGDNVVAIQGISASRRDELNVLIDYFVQNGIPTEIIIDRTGYALLVTKQGFQENPENAGTAGNELLQKIRKLGQQYSESTGDTKFGSKPFQDSYGYKR